MNEDYKRYTTNIMGAISEVFEEESDYYIGSLDELDTTQFFTALLSATGLLYNELTGDHKNMVETTHLLNSLAVQKAVQSAKGDE